MIFFLIFPENRFWNFMQIEKICKKCQTLFSGKNKKKYFKMLSAEALTITTLWVNSADDKLMIFFYLFIIYQKTGFDISCKLSP